MPVLAPRKRPKTPSKTETYEFRDFTGGVNLTDARTGIRDNELAWLENVIPIGSGALQLLNGPAASIGSLAQGIARGFGVVMNGSPLHILVGTNGSLTQMTPGGVATAISGSASTTRPVVAMWRGTTLLILDPSTGYHTWDGATFTTISATQIGTAIAVFQGRVWIINGRLITFTAPNTFSNFSAADGAGTTVLTDEAFPGNVNAAVSALEQLWLVGSGAVEALSNVVSTGISPNVVTTFSLTNIVSNLGSNAQLSVTPYFRALTFIAPFGVYALAGVTPQKISEKLDGLFPSLTISTDTAMGAVAVVQNLLCLIFRVTYTGQSAQAGPGPIPLLLIFQGGRWSFAHQGAVVWLWSLIVDGVAQAWATDGTTVYRLFGADNTTAVVYKIQGKLSPFGLSTTEKASLKSGLEFQASATIAPTMTIDNETANAETAALQTTVPVTWVNDAGGIVTFVNNSGEAVTWRAQGMVLSRQVSSMYGSYLGWTITGTDPPYRLQSVALNLLKGREWVTPATSAG